MGWKMAAYRLVCEVCDQTFIAKGASAKYCSDNCRHVMFPNFVKKEKMQRVCVHCNVTFYTTHPNKKTCSQICADGMKQEQIRTRRADAFKRSVDRAKDKIAGDYRYLFCNEADFSNWFGRTYWVYGIRKLLSHGTRFPDVTALDSRGRVLRIELEYNAANFKQHNHPATCDVIMSMMASTDRVAGIPVVALFAKENGILTPTNYLQGVMSVGESLLSRIVPESETYFEKINCTYPVERVLQEID